MQNSNAMHLRHEMPAQEFECSKVSWRAGVTGAASRNPATATHRLCPSPPHTQEPSPHTNLPALPPSHPPLST